MTTRPFAAPTAVRWGHHVSVLVDGHVDLTPRYTLHAAPDTKALRRAQRGLGRLWETLGASGFEPGAAVAETSPAGAGWYVAVDDGPGTRHWIRGGGLSQLGTAAFTEVMLFSGMCLWGTGALRAATVYGEVALTSSQGRNVADVVSIASMPGLSVYENAVSAVITGLAGMLKRVSALTVHPELCWELPAPHYLMELLDSQGRPLLRPELWRQWQEEVSRRVALVHGLVVERSQAAGFQTTHLPSLAALSATVHGHTPGRTPQQALTALAGDDEVWRVVASVRTVRTYPELARLAYATEILRTGCPAFHGQHGRLLIVIEDPAEGRILMEARAIAAAAGLRLATVGLYPLAEFLPSEGGSLYACGLSQADREVDTTTRAALLGARTRSTIADACIADHVLAGPQPQGSPRGVVPSRSPRR